MLIRPATVSNLPALKALWQTCFDENESFLDWFFDKRFLPDYCMCLSADGKIVSAVHGLPVHVHLRDAVLPAVIAGGVATLPEARGLGHMHEVFAAFMRMMRANGAAAVICRPVDIRTYQKLGQFPCADVRFASLPADAQRPTTPDQVEECDMRAQCSALHRCYSAFCERYSCAVSRSYADFAYKCEDYLADHARCIAVWEGERAMGYCVYFDEGNALYGDECVALSPQAYDALYRAMATLSAGKALRLRLPPDVALCGDAVIETVPYSVIGALDAQRLLGATGLDIAVPIEVTDGVIFENNGVFLPSGRKTNAAPLVKLSAGRLAEWAVGYRSMAELVRDGFATADARAVAALDCAGKRICHIVEEY